MYFIYPIPTGNPHTKYISNIVEVCHLINIWQSIKYYSRRRHNDKYTFVTT